MVQAGLYLSLELKISQYLHELEISMAFFGPKFISKSQRMTGERGNTTGYCKDQPYISHCVEDSSHVALQKMNPPKIPHRADNNIH